MKTLDYYNRDLKDNILLTVFIPTYNRSNYLRQSIISVLNQTYENFILVILDNASTDDTFNIVKEFTDSRIIYIKHNTNIGGIENLNYAIKNCFTKYFVIFHDDDIMLPEMLYKELEVMEKSNYSIISINAENINSLGNIINESQMIELPTLKKEFKGNQYIDFYFNGGSLVCPSVMYRNSFFKKHNLFFSKKVGPVCDQFMWFEVERLGGSICLLSNKLMQYRIHESQDSAINSNTMMAQFYRSLYESTTYYKYIQNRKKMFAYKFQHCVSHLGIQFHQRILSREAFISNIKLLPIDVLEPNIKYYICNVHFKIAEKLPKLYGYLIYIVFIIIKKLRRIKAQLKKGKL